MNKKISKRRSGKLALTSGQQATIACALSALATLDVVEAIAYLAGAGIVFLGPQTVAAVRAFINSLTSGGGNSVACSTTHKVSTTAQGPGVCCAALTASGQTPVVGLRIAATNKLGKCIVCEVKASTSKKNPGVLVFKRGKAVVPGSPVSCPTSAEGCCALSGQ